MGIRSGIHFSEEKAEHVINTLYIAHGAEAVHVYAQWVELPYAYCGGCEEMTPFQTGGHDPNHLQGPCSCYICGDTENM